MSTRSVSSSNSGDRPLVFVSYSHADSKWLARLRVHLKPLERQGAIALWDDTRIKPGTSWQKEIRSNLENAKVAVLLVSADFLASDFIATNELPPLLQAAERHGTLILPLIVKPSRFEKTDGLARFQAVNPPSKPLSLLAPARREEWFVKLSGIIEDALASSGPVAVEEAEVLPTKETRDRSEKKELAKRHVLRYRFWQQLLELAKKRGLSFHASRAPNTTNWIGGNSGIPGCRWNYVIWMEDAAVELAIDTGDKRKNKRLFDALRSRKAAIETAFGASLDWQRLDDARRAKIRYILRVGGLTAPQEEWPSIQTAMVDSMARLSKVLQPDLQGRAGASLKYHPLGDYLAARQDQAALRLSFAEIEKIIAQPLPASARKYREWWSNQSSTSGHPQAAAWLNAGFKVGTIHQDREGGWVEFVRKHDTHPPQEGMRPTREGRFGPYIVRELDSGSIEVERDGRLLTPTKPALRQLASELHVGLLNRSGNPMNTRQLGSLIITRIRQLENQKLKPGSDPGPSVLPPLGIESKSSNSEETRALELRAIDELSNRELDREIALHFLTPILETTDPTTGSTDYHVRKFGRLVVGDNEQWRQPRVPEYASDPAAARDLDRRLEAAGAGAKQHYQECLRLLSGDPAHASLRQQAIAFVHACRAGLIPSEAWN